MGGSHAQRGDDVAVQRTPRNLLVGALVAAFLATLVGVAWLWPDGDRVDALSDDVRFAAPGVSFPEAEVLEVLPACPDGRPADDCGQLRVRVAEGEDDGTEVAVGVPGDVLDGDLSTGDDVKLIRTPAQGEQPATLEYFGTARTAPVGLMLAIFVGVVLAVARLRGLMALSVWRSAPR